MGFREWNPSLISYSPFPNTYIPSPTMSTAVKAGSAFVEIGMKTAGFDQHLKAAESKLSSFATAVSMVGGTIGNQFNGVISSVNVAFNQIGGMIQTAVTMPLKAAIGDFLVLGDDIQKMALRTGFSAETLSALNYAAEQSGTILSDVEKSIRTLQRRITEAAQGSKSARKELESLGLSFEALKKLTPEHQFFLVTGQLSKIKDETEKVAMAANLLGRSGAQLLPMLEDGLDGVISLMKEAEELGVVISKEDADNAALFGDAIDRVRKIYLGMKMKISATLAETLTKALDVIRPYLVTVSDMISRNRQLVSVMALAAFAVSGFALSLAIAGRMAFSVMSILNLTGMAFGMLWSIAASGISVLGMVTGAFYALYSSMVLLVAGALKLATFIAFRAMLLGLNAASVLLTGAIMILQGALAAVSVTMSIASGVIYALAVAHSAAGIACNALIWTFAMLKAAILAVASSTVVYTAATWLLYGAFMVVAVSMNVTMAASNALRLAIIGLKTVVGILRAAFLAMVGACASIRIGFVLTRAAIFLFNATVSATTMLTKMMIGVFGLMKMGVVALTSVVAACKAIFALLNIEMLLAYGIVIGVVGGLAIAAMAMIDFGKVGQKLAGTFKGVFATLWQSFAGTFGAIKKALMSGDISGAAKVLWADLIYRFTLGKKAVVIIFQEIRDYISGVWQNLQISLASTFGLTWEELAEGWNKFCDGFLSVFKSVVNGIKTMWTTFGSWYTKMLAFMMAKANGLDPKETIRIAQEDYARRMGLMKPDINASTNPMLDEFKGVADRIRDRIGELADDPEVKKSREELDRLIKAIQEDKEDNRSPETQSYLDELQAQMAALSANGITGLSSDSNGGGNAGGSFSAFEALGGMQTSSIDKDQLDELKRSNDLAAETNKGIHDVNRNIMAMNIQNQGLSYKTV